jgi:hypothetical protein
MPDEPDDDEAPADAERERALEVLRGPREFGGMGGAAGGRPRDPDDLFEAALDRAFGERLRRERADGIDAHKADDDDNPGLWYRKGLGARLWGSLANVDWTHTNGDTAGYSFRAAGDMIAAIVGEGDYMDWYCSGDHGVLDDEVAEGMAREGWTARVME